VTRPRARVHMGARPPNYFFAAVYRARVCQFTSLSIVGIGMWDNSPRWAPKKKKRGGAALLTSRKGHAPPSFPAAFGNGRSRSAYEIEWNEISVRRAGCLGDRRASPSLSLRPMATTESRSLCHLRAMARPTPPGCRR